MGLSLPVEAGPICRYTGKAQCTKSGAKSEAKRKGRRGIYVAAYRCPLCDKWHVGGRGQR